MFSVQTLIVAALLAELGLVVESSFGEGARSYSFDLSKSDLTRLYDSPVHRAVRMRRPLGSLSFQLGPLSHSGVKVTLRDGSTWLVHKGDGFGISSQTVVVDARHMSTSWQDDSVVDPDYSIEVYTEEDDIDIDDDDDDDSPGEDTSRKKARTESGGRGNHGRGMKGRGRGFPQHKKKPNTSGQQVVEAEETSRGARKRTGPSRGSRGRGRGGRGVTQGGEDCDEERPGTSRDVPSRARRRARGRRGRGPAVLTHDDLLRVQQFQQERIAAEQARIQALDITQSHELLLTCLERDPSMLFDLMAHSQVQDDSQIIRTPGQPEWCVCGRCKQMIRDIEKVCCRQTLENCISVLPHMDAFILQPGVLRMARRIWNDSRALDDAQTPGESHRQFRFSAYRQYIIWQYGQLGQGHRVVIPSCCVWRIRETYPDPNGIYKGFIPSRNGMDEE